MSSVIAELFVSIGADVANAMKGFQQVESGLKGFSSTANAALPASAALAGAAVGIGAGFFEAIKTAADFEAQMSGIKAVMAPDDVRQFGGALKDLALQLGADTVFSSKEAAAGIEELVKAGLKATDILGGAAKASLDLAAATGVSVADAATIAANAMNAFSLTVDALPGVMDHLAGVVNATSADMSQLSFGLQASGAVAHEAGLSFDDTATTLGVLINAGLKGSDAGTSLKTMLLGLIPSTKSATNEFERLGLFTIDSTTAMMKMHEILSSTPEGMEALAKAFKDGSVSAEELFKSANKLHLVKEDSLEKWAQHAGLATNAFFDASGRMKSMAEVAGILKEALTGLTQEQQLSTLHTLFGTDAMRAASIIATEGAEGFNTLAGEISKISVSATAAERMNNLNGAMKNLGGSVEKLMITVGEMFLPALTSVALALTGVVNTISSLPGPVQAAIVGIVGVVGALAGIAGVIGLAAAAAGPLIVGFTALGALFTTMIPAVAAFGVALALAFWPITLAIAAMALLVVAWQNDWGGIREIVEPVIARLVDLWNNTLLPALKNFGSFIGTYVFPFIGALVNLYLAPLQAAIKGLAWVWENVLLPGFQATGTILDTYVMAPLRGIFDFFKQLVSAIASNPLLENLPGVQGIKALIEAAPAALTGATAAVNSAADTVRGGGPAPIQINIEQHNTVPDQATADAVGDSTHDATLDALHKALTNGAPSAAPFAGGAF